MKLYVKKPHLFLGAVNSARNTFSTGRKHPFCLGISTHKISTKPSTGFLVGWLGWYQATEGTAGEGNGSHLSEEVWESAANHTKKSGKNAEIYGCFQKWWYPKSSILIGVFHHKPSILGYHNFWKHPYAVDRWLVCSTIADCGDVWSEGSKSRSSNA